MTTTVYKSCGFLGFGAKAATEQDFKDSGYRPSAFSTSCGFLGFGGKKATIYSIPSAWRQDCTPLSGTKNGTFEVTAAGSCTLQSCAPGAIKVGPSRCVEPGTSCVPSDPQPHASYTYAPTGNCSLSSCATGTVKRPEYSVTSIGSSTCDANYTSIKDEASCKAAAAKYGIPFSKVSEPGLLSGCVVHGDGTAAGKMSFNTDPSGVDSGGQQFLVCTRGVKDPCITIGGPCGSGSNYKYNSAGFCQGDCTDGKACATGQKCCSGTCFPSASQCPAAKEMADEARSVASQLKAVAGNINSMKSSVESLKSVKF